MANVSMSMSNGKYEAALRAWPPCVDLLPSSTIPERALSSRRDPDR